MADEQPETKRARVESPAGQGAEDTPTNDTTTPTATKPDEEGHDTPHQELDWTAHLANLPSLKEWIDGGSSYSSRNEPSDGVMDTRSARFPSSCICGQPVEVGEAIVRNAFSRTWVHAACVDYKPPVAAPRPRPNTTDEQDAVVDHMRNTNQSLCLNCGAGSGKSTIIMEVMAMIMGERPVSNLILVFNKEAQLSLSGKLSDVHLSLKAWTFHGLCNKFWRTYAPVKPKHDMHKSRNILQMLYPADADGRSKKVAAKVEPLVKHVCDVVKLIKNDALGCPGNEDVTVKTVMELQMRYAKQKDLNDIYNDHPELYNSASELSVMTSKLAVEVMAESVRQATFDSPTADFEDLVYMPTMKSTSAQLPKYKLIVIDEAQDLNALRLDLVYALLATDGRVMFVGDSNQCIYGFAGSINNVMATATARFSAATLHLTVTFRCSQAVVKATNGYYQRYSEYLPNFQFVARPGAPEGCVVSGTSFHAYPITTDSRDVAVLSRKSASLVQLYYELAKRNVRVQFLGREQLGTAMVRCLEEAITDAVKTVDDLTMALSMHLAAYDPDPGAVTKNEEARNRFEALLGLLSIMMEEASDVTLAQVRARIDEFKYTPNRKGDTVLATVHKAKGQEYDTVYILAPEDLPMANTMGEGALWEKQNEVACGYVAYSRAKTNLYLLSSVESVSELFEPPGDGAEDGSGSGDGLGAAESSATNSGAASSSFSSSSDTE